MRRARIALLLPLTVLSCGDDTDWSLPGGVERSVIYVSPSDPLTLEAIDRTAALPGPADRGAARAPVTALAYEATLAQLALVAGPLPLARTRTRPRRPLPPTTEVFERTEESPWSPVELSSEIAALRIVSPARDQCLDLGGCAQSVDGDASCLLPCVTPAIEPAAQPELPRELDLTPCPDGWQLIERYGQSVCAPPPAVAPCAAGLTQWASSDRCEVLQTPCPAGRFAEGLPPTTVYTSATTTGTPDGTIGAPFPTIERALAAAPEDGIIALAAETFVEPPLTITKRVTIVGACATSVIDTPVGVEADVQGDDLTIAGPITVDNGAHLSLDRVSLEGTGVTIAGTATLAAVLTRAPIRVSATGRVTANRFASEGVRGPLDVDGSFVGRNVAIRRAQMKSAAVAGELRLASSVVEQSARGIDVEADAIVTLEDVAIRNLTERTEAAAGVHIDGDGEAVLSRVFIDDVPYAGVRVLFGTLVATNLAITDPFGAPGQDAFGVAVTNGAADLAAVFVGGVPTQALRSFRSTMTVDDARLVNVAMTGVAVNRGALYADEDATLDATRVEIVDAGGPAAFFGAGTHSTVRDLVVRGISVPASTAAVRIDADADVTIERAAVEEVDGVAIEAATRAALDDVTVSAVGTAFRITGSADVTGNRVVIIGAATAGVELLDSAVVTFGHVTIADSATGVAVGPDASILVADVDIGGSTSAALATEGAGYELRRGVVHDNAVGVDGPVEWRQLVGVRFSNNQSRFAED